MNEEHEPNAYELLSDYYCYEYLKYKKTFTWKAFKKFTWVKQQLLCERYNIILTGHKTKGEKYRELSKGIIGGMTLKNLNKGINKFNHGMDQFNKMIEPTGKNKELKLANYKEMNDLLGSGKKQSFKLHNADKLKKLIGR